MITFSGLHLKRYVSACILASFAIFTCFSLLTFSMYDTSLFFSDTSVQSINNCMGYAGAYYASLLLYFFGFSAWLFVPLFALLTVRVLHLFPEKYLIDRAVGCALFLFAHSTLCAYLDYDLYGGVIAGGLVGTLVQKSLSAAFAHGALERGIMIVLLWCACVLIFRFSWAHVVVRYSVTLGAYLHLEKIALLVRSLKQNMSERMQKVLARLWKHEVPDEPTLESLLTDTMSGVELPEPTDNLFTDPVWTNLRTQKTDEGEKQEAHFSPSMLEKPQSSLYHEQEHDHVPYSLPTASMLMQPQEKDGKKSEERLRERGRLLEEKLEHFGVFGKVTSMVSGPTVTLFEYQPRIDMKISSIVAREDDLALALQALSLRIIAPIPGTAVIGFEVANQHRDSVCFSECVRSVQVNESGQQSLFEQYKLPLVLGKDAVGSIFAADLTALPHLLIAGSTGSGKSVGLHTMIMSLLFKATPDQMKLILIDPKRIEFSPFADLPHLLFPIQTQARSAILALQWAVRTMEERYEMMAREGVRNIHEFHAQFGQEALPFIVIIIDELADLMMTGGKDCEELITRLAQMARAAGMHLIAATQRPSVDVITGLIKVNFPARSAFKVASKIDSRTILDMSGAEKLLSKGDMLFLEPAGSLRRIQGAFISNKEIASVVNAIKSQRKVEYLPLAVPTAEACALDDEDTELYEQVRTFVDTIEEVSISLLQRKFRIGYNRSARIFDKLQSEGVIAASDGGKLRKVVKKSDANV